MTALEMGLIREVPIGQMLVESGFISKRILDTALKLQEIVSSHSLSALKAAEGPARGSHRRARFAGPGHLVSLIWVPPNRASASGWVKCSRLQVS